MFIRLATACCWLGVESMCNGDPIGATSLRVGVGVKKKARSSDCQNVWKLKIFLIRCLKILNLRTTPSEHVVTGPILNVF